MRTFLFLMLGYPGSGKTTISKMISKELDIPRFNSDEIRRKMFTSVEEIKNVKLNPYVFGALNYVVEASLRSGISIIYDANNNRVKDRNISRIIADKQGATTIIVWVKTPIDIAKQWEVDRRANIDHLSMARNVEIQHLFIAGKSPEEQLDVARDVQRFVYEDFLRVGAAEEEARSIADPDDDDRVARQLERIKQRSQGTVYSKVVENGNTEGIVKIGPWLPGDEAPFGIGRRLASHIRQFTQPLEAVPRGLHVFVVREGLALAALQALRSPYAIESHVRLNAAIHENDDELHQAFTELGAPKDGPSGQIRLGNYLARYILRSLPPEEE